MGLGVQVLRVPPIDLNSSVAEIGMHSRHRGDYAGATPAGGTNLRSLDYTEREPDKRAGIGWKPMGPTCGWGASPPRSAFPLFIDMGCEPDKRAGAVLKTDGALFELGEHVLRIRQFFRFLCGRDRNALLS